MLRTSKKARKQAALFHSRASIGVALPGAPQTSSVGRPQQPFLPRPRVSVTSESSENQLEGSPLGAQEKDDDEMEELEGAHIARVQLSSYATSTQQHNEVHPQLQDRQRPQQLGLERSREGLALPEERAYISTSASASVSASTTNGEGEDFCFDLDDRAASGSEPTDLSITEVSPTPPSRQERKVHSLDREGSLEASLASRETRQGNGYIIEKRLDTDERIKKTFGEEQGETLERDWGHDHDGAGMYPDKDSSMSSPVAPPDDVDVLGKDGVLSNLGVDDVPNIIDSVNKADDLPGRQMIVDVSSKSSSPLSSPTSESRANELSDELQNDADDEDDINGTGADAEVHSDSSSLPTLTPSPSPRRLANVVENAEGDNREELYASDETEGDATATAVVLPKRTTSKTFRSPKQVVSEPLASGRAKRQLTKSSKAIEAEEMRWLSPKRRKMAPQQVHEQDPRSTSVEKQEYSRPRSAKLQRSSKLSEVRSDLEHKEAQSATELPPVPVKRGRGRPRKHPLPTVLPGASTSGSQNAPSALLTMKNSSAQKSLAGSNRGAKRLIPPSRSRHEISTNAFYRRRRGELPNSPLGTSFKSSVPTATGPRSNIKTQRRSASLSLLRKATLRRSDREIDTETVNPDETEEATASDEESIIVEAPKRRGRPPSSGTKAQ
ncbi:hypothetical protein FA10DRAFT_82523 [Acaromyces ingoldii]|uniref:Uncharacterized protein n=1 Tax=Acaromyces ingoldii TaxID=215250 RepID=A0A316YSI2_9BASI|nr:hypothetical protein FA10DRAFT_82523 [Acaromyces ingoldii]PWN92082.1 hypothetical protein FA10DRAFT_82523 [Acaromyces ingoldii]